jgi:hypothetical protein
VGSFGWLDEMSSLKLHYPIEFTLENLHVPFEDFLLDFSIQFSNTLFPHCKHDQPTITILFEQSKSQLLLFAKVDKINHEDYIMDEDAASSFSVFSFQN